MNPVLMIVAATIALFLAATCRKCLVGMLVRLSSYPSTSVTRQFRSLTLRVLDRPEPCSNVGQLL